MNRTIRGVQALGVLAAGWAALGGGVPCVRADCRISSSTATALRIENDGLKAMDDCAAMLREAFKGDDSTLREARARVLSPLIENNASVAFRLEYEERLLPILKPMIADKNEYKAINALRLAGELAGKNSLDLLQDGLKDARSAVRMMAASGYERSFSVIVTSTSTAISKPRADQAIKELADALSREQNALVLDSIITALGRATELGSKEFDQTGYHALTRIASDVGQRIKALDGAKTEPGETGDILIPVLRAATVIQDALRGLVPKDDPMRIDENLRVAMAGFVGDGLGQTLKRVNAGGLSAMDDSTRQKVAELSARCELILAQIMTQMGKRFVEVGLKNMIEAGEEAKYKAAVLNLIGRDGPLCKQPFSFSAERFK